MDRTGRSCWTSRSPNLSPQRSSAVRTSLRGPWGCVVGVSGTTAARRRGRKSGGMAARQETGTYYTRLLLRGCASADTSPDRGFIINARVIIIAGLLHSRERYKPYNSLEVFRPYRYVK